MHACMYTLYIKEEEKNVHNFTLSIMQETCNMYTPYMYMTERWSGAEELRSGPLYHDAVTK